jgi:WhiB family transcriptional regulator, redox-sensing transcriptional regulator
MRRETLAFRKVHWMEEAACKDADPDLFFPVSGTTEPRNGEAVRICSRCPVWEECRRWGFETKDGFAILGGLTSNQRSRIVNKRKRAAA